MDDLESMLRARLRQPDIPVPDTVDAAILGAAHDAAIGFRRRRTLRLVRVAAAAAAAVVVGAWLGTRLLAPAERSFDVVDAWRVAAGIDHGERFDLDGDGRVDRGDADLMLARIVALEPRRKS